MDYAIAALDIGKTNKKIVVYTPDLRPVHTSRQSVPCITQNGLEVEDTASLRSWLVDALSCAASHYPVRAIAVAAHGATFACLGQDGRLAFPVLSYTNEPGEDFHRAFFDRYGSASELQARTATLQLPALINLAQGIEYARVRFPDEMRRASAILFYPQYFGYLLTGRVAAELTYAGSHTYLWDFDAGRWSEVALQMGVDQLLPARPGQPWDILGTLSAEMAEATGLSREVMVTLGIHDSNASLLPYLLRTTDDFVLNSTGTWCVAMHNETEVRFAPDEIGAAVYYNITAFGNPLKSANLMAGFEYDSFARCFTELFSVLPQSAYDPELYRRVVAEKRCFVLPGIVANSGQYPRSRAAVFIDGNRIEFEQLEASPDQFASIDAEQLYAALNLSLAIQTRVALTRAGLRPGAAVFTEGGFRNNEAYLALLTALLPGNPSYVTSLDEATAFGAAITAKVAYERIAPSAVTGLYDIETRLVPETQLQGIEEYATMFDRLACPAS